MQTWIARWKGFFYYKDLLRNLVMRDIKLKYRRSVLGYLWSVMDPLFSMIVMTIVFSTMFRRNIENYPVYLFTGQLLFNFLRNSTLQAMNSINTNGSLIKKAYVPKYIFTFSKIISALVDLVFNLVALLLVMLVTKTQFSVYNLLFPVVLIQVSIFSLGLGLFLAQANVFFKDVQHIYSVVLMAWTYLTPLFYPIEALPDVVRWWVAHFNPMYFYVTQFRDLFYYGRMLQLRDVIAGTTVSVFMLLFGMITFLKNQDRFILHV